MTTPILSLAEIAESQANKYITHNEALRAIEATTIRALSDSTDAEPVSPAEGDTYIITATATGTAWSTFAANDVAWFSGGVWQNLSPPTGLMLFIVDLGAPKQFNGTSWSADIGVSAAGATYDNTSSLLTATNAQAAIDESYSITAHKATTHNFTTDADYTLTTEQEKYGRIILTDTTPVLTAARSVIVSTDERPYVIQNDTAQTLTVKTSAGTGVAVAAGADVQVQCDGTNVIEVGTDFAAMPQVAGDPIVEEGSNANGSYVRFASGWQTCIKYDFDINSVLTAEILAATWTYPSAFVSSPTISVLPTQVSNADATPTFEDYFNPGSTTPTTTSVSIRLFSSGASFVAGDHNLACVTATGHWK